MEILYRTAGSCDERTGSPDKINDYPEADEDVGGSDREFHDQPYEVEYSHTVDVSFAGLIRSTSVRGLVHLEFPKEEDRRRLHTRLMMMFAHRAVTFFTAPRG